jgi:hypothetical protein
MRRLLPFLLLTILFSVAPPALGQEETLIEGKIESGGFGGPVIRFSDVKGEFAVFVGGRGAWIVNHSFYVGAAGYGLANAIDLDNHRDYWPHRDIEFGYGGVEFGYIHDSNRLVHFTIGALIGGGGVTRNEDFDVFYDDDAVFVLEPTADLELNVSRLVRIAAGGGYRLVTGTHAPGLDNGDLSAPFASLTVKIGKF